METIRSMLFGGTTKPASNPHNWPNSPSEALIDRPQRLIKVGLTPEQQPFAYGSNYVKTSKYEPWTFLGKFLLEEFNFTSGFANCYFLVISGLQCIPAISNTGGIPATLLPLTFVLSVDAVFAIMEDVQRHKADHIANASIAHRFRRERMYGSRAGGGGNNSHSNSMSEASSLQEIAAIASASANHQAISSGRSVDAIHSECFEDCKWSELEVGDFVRVDTREMVPADILILSVAEKSSPPTGIAYVETKSLDGETNLKIRNALPSTLAKVNAVTLSKIKGDLRMEHPNKLIDAFSGVIEIEGLQKEPVQPNNVLLRGCGLRNTDYIIGMVINTGHDTKIMMSMNTTRQKTSDLEQRTSIEIGRIVLLLCVICFTGATGHSIVFSLNNIGTDFTYLQFNPEPVGFWFINFFYFLLLHATFIPVSLYVSMTIIRYGQAYFMNNDLEMYYEKLDAPCVVRTMTLNEELGQVSHIFSDKTGTLTCNIMDFRKASINGVQYGMGITEIGRAAWKLQNREISDEILEGERLARERSVPHVTFYDKKYTRDMEANGPQAEKIQQFFRIIALCHDVIAENVGDSLKLSASNPDDDALVCAAAYFGFKFFDRREKICYLENSHIKQPLDKVEKVEVLNTIAFSSKRKRMAVIIRDTDGKIKILSKGADTVMFERVRSGQDHLLKQTEKHMKEYSVEGLRCLIVGYAVLSEADYTTWNEKYQHAITDLVEIDKRKADKPNAIDDLEDKIERNYTLVGCTALEDKLQDGVPDAIADLAKSGINIWVLTGDKEETAINIAVACNLLLPKEYMDHIIVNTTFAPNDEAMKELFLAEIKRYDADAMAEGDALLLKPRALVIDGPSLIRAMADESYDGLRDLLLELSQRCKAVVACRVSPDQKRQMVDLIQTGIPGVRTLAIGDGANDVAMIQEAHIGVGIKGEEGLQAVNASDYAIAQFRFLSVLMLKHGRYNYIRMSNLVLYMFYKNILMSVGQFWFNFSCAFTGQKYYTEGTIQLFNAAYTFVPILLYGVYDMDISPQAVRQFPQTYMACINQEYFSPSLFWAWILTAFGESTILSVLPLYTLSNSEHNTGMLSTHWEAGATCFTALVIVVNMKMFFIQNRWYWFNWLFLFLSMVVYFSSVLIITNALALDFEWYQVFDRLTGNGSFWLTVLLLVATITAKDVYTSGLERNFNFKPEHIIQEMEANGVGGGAGYARFKNADDPNVTANNKIGGEGEGKLLSSAKRAYSPLNSKNKVNVLV